MSTSYLALVHLNRNAAVSVAGGDNNAILTHRSEIKADLQPCIYYKLFRCKKRTAISLVS